MSRQIFVALAVAEVAKAREFFSSLGFKFNDQFSNESTATMIVSETISIQLHQSDNFKFFVPNAVCDTKKSNEVSLCLTLESDDAVKAMVVKAVAGGGATYEEPRDHGFMFHHSFKDLDGHLWELVHWRG
jgi:predicted lactoylglutathione lyase